MHRTLVFFQEVQVCIYQEADNIRALPAGGDGEGVTNISVNEQCFLRPKGEADLFVLQVFELGLLGAPLHDGIEVRRGDRIVIRSFGKEVRCFAEVSCVQ